MVRKLPGDKRELQIQVLALSDLKLISIKCSLEEREMACAAWQPGTHSKPEQGLEPGDALPRETSEPLADQSALTREAGVGGSLKQSATSGELPLLGPLL